MYIVSTNDRAIMIGTFYEETGGHEKAGAAQKTDDLLKTLVEKWGSMGGSQNA